MLFLEYKNKKKIKFFLYLLIIFRISKKKNSNHLVTKNIFNYFFKKNLSLLINVL